MKISVYDGLSGQDEVFGTSSADEIYIRRSQATVEAYGGNDTIQVMKDGDVLVNAGAGDDNIRSEGNYVTINGGAGADIISVYRSYNYVAGDAGNDQINVSGLYNDIEKVTISGGTGNDVFRFDPTGSTSYDAKGNTIDVIITDLSNGDTLRNGYVDNIGLEYSISGNNIILTEPGQGAVKVTVQGVTSIDSISEVVYRTKNESKTLGEIFSDSDGSGELVFTLPTSENETTTSTTSTNNNSASTNANTGNVTNNYYIDNSTNINGNNNIVNFGDNSSTGNTITTNNTDNSMTTNNIDNSVTYNYTYSGGNRVINNYQQGEVVQLNDFQGINFNGNSFYILSNSGALELQNVRDKFVSYSYGNSDVIAYSYLGSSGGTIDGRDKSNQLGVMIGGNYFDNQIYAGNGGSSLWGGLGGDDILSGGDGYDEIFYTAGSGSDVVQNVGDNDVVNLLGVSLSQITAASVTDSEISASFADGGTLNVKGNSNVGFKIDGVTYAANRSNGSWYAK